MSKSTASVTKMQKMMQKMHIDDEPLASSQLILTMVFQNQSLNNSSNHHHQQQQHRDRSRLFYRLRQKKKQRRLQHGALPVRHHQYQHQLERERQHQHQHQHQLERERERQHQLERERQHQHQHQHQHQLERERERQHQLERERQHQHQHQHQHQLERERERQHQLERERQHQHQHQLERERQHQHQYQLQRERERQYQHQHGHGQQHGQQIEHQHVEHMTINDHEQKRRNKIVTAIVGSSIARNLSVKNIESETDEVRLRFKSGSDCADALAWLESTDGQIFMRGVNRIIFVIGTNDIHRVGAFQTVQRIDRTIEIVRRLYPVTNIVWQLLQQRTRKTWLLPEGQAVVNEIEKCNVLLLELAAKRKFQTIQPAIPIQYMYDGLHPSKYGVAMMEATIRNHLQKK